MCGVCMLVWFGECQSKHFNFLINFSPYAMSRPFARSRGRPFQQLNESVSASDFLQAKKNRVLRCFPCARKNELSSEHLDVYQLYTNLHTTSLWTDVAVVSPPLLDASASLPLVVDPSGQLFGNDACGLLNFIEYRVLRTT